MFYEQRLWRYAEQRQPGAGTIALPHDLLNKKAFLSRIAPLGNPQRRVCVNTLKPEAARLVVELRPSRFPCC